MLSVHTHGDLHCILADWFGREKKDCSNSGREEKVKISTERKRVYLKVREVVAPSQVQCFLVVAKKNVQTKSSQVY